jgi:hypothetical protein
VLLMSAAVADFRPARLRAEAQARRGRRSSSWNPR